jgi:glutathione synthase/RimK-type ligase-like ATP-grasp enzyme
MTYLFSGKFGEKLIKKIYSYMESNSRLVVANEDEADTVTCYYEPSNLNVSIQCPTFNTEGSTVIRWGTRKILPNGHTALRIINAANHIKKASDKHAARKIFENNNIRCPKNVTLDNASSSDFPLIARPHHHTQCNDLTILSNVDAFINFQEKSPNSYYYAPFLKKEGELRFYVAGRDVVAAVRRPWDSKAICHHDVDERSTILNLEFLDDGLSRLAIEAVRALRLSFGAVDIMLVGENYTPYVLEVNTAFGLCMDVTEDIIKAYAKYFDTFA